MSLKVTLEIEGAADGEPIDVSVRGPGSGNGSLVDPEDRRGMQPPDDTRFLGDLSLGDPEDRRGMQPPDDTSFPGDLSLGDPEDRRGMQPPDDTAADGAGRSGGAGCRRGASGGYARPAPVRTGPPPPVRYSGFVILRLSDLVPVAAPAAAGAPAGLEEPNEPDNPLVDLARELGLRGLLRVLTRFGNPPTSRAVTTPNAVAYDEEEAVTLDDLERRAAGSELAPRHSLWSYFRLDGRGLAILGDGGGEAIPETGIPYTETEAVERLVDQLNDLSVVDLAYREIAASDPNGDPTRGGPPSRDELSDFQLYLGRFGLDALWAQRQIDDGNGQQKVGLADLEQGWITDHEELHRALAGPLSYGDNRHDSPSYRGDHGTAVVGELISRENRAGVVGIVDGRAEIALASHYRASDPARGDAATIPGASNGHVADAIAALITGERPLRAGDVLLLEVERGGHPTEIAPLDFDAIRLASAAGVIVVEAAGNGGLDLDRVMTVDGRSLDRRSTGFADSGAIVVGATLPAAPHDRAHFSNFGSRLDCYGWGGGVVSAGYGDFLDGDDRARYTDTFSGTSSAAPMIAGAAVLVQTVYRRNAAPDVPADEDPDRWGRLAPRQMRALLADPRTGFAQGPDVGGHVGVMPNLRAVLDRALGVVPRVYLRDHVGDVGDVPLTRRECASPDLGVSGGKKVRVRLRNRGLKTAEEVCATVYRAPVSTLVTPDRWQEVGRTAATSVPQGDRPVWTSLLADRDLGDACLVAVVDHPGGPEGPRPCPAASVDWRAFLAMLRARTDLALRNVHRADPSRPLPFRVNGAPDAPRAFELQVIQRLPEGVTVGLRAQLGLALKCGRGRLWRVQRGKEDMATLYLPRQPRLRLGILTLPPAVDFPCRFELRGAERVRLGHSLAIRQLYRGQEVGRITWNFV